LSIEFEALFNVSIKWKDHLPINNVTINHIFRQGNSGADWLAKFGLLVHSTNVWDAVPHRDLCFILVEDNLG